MIFVCPSLGGCHLPLYKSYDHFIGAKNINEAKRVMQEWIDLEKLNNDTFFVNKIRRDKVCIEMEEGFKLLSEMSKK